MCDPWKRKQTVIWEAARKRQIETTDNLLLAVRWKSNVSPRTLTEAVDFAIRGDDGGEDLTKSLRPVSLDADAWDQWNKLVCQLVERDTNWRSALEKI